MGARVGDRGTAGQDSIFAAAPLPVAALDHDERVACLRLIRSENVGPATFRALINHFGGAKQALAALPDVGRRVGRGKAIRICSQQRAEAELEAVAKAGAQTLFTIEPGYPAPLAFLDGAPPMIYAKGRIELLSGSIVAMVGSRQASAAGQQLARRFAAELGADGHVVASGLARGIDAAAHRGALDTGTVAVLAGGIDMIYPPENKGLYHEIAERGCLVAELPIGYQARAQDFPRRNRIISGVSRGVVIVEAARRSGTLITARLAAEQGREVFAVPGHPLDPRAEGTNQLIKDGATMVTAAEDVSRALSEQFVARSTALDTRRLDGPPGGMAEWPAPERLLSVDEGPASDDTVLTRIESVLGPAPVNIDEIARATGLPVRSVQISLMELALTGQVEFHGSQLVSRRLADASGGQ